MRCVRCKATEGGTRMCAECRRELRELKRDAAEVASLFDEACADLQQAEMPRAGRTLQKLLRRDPSHIGAYESLILAYGQMGKLDRATATLSAMHRFTSPVLEGSMLKSRVKGRGRSLTLKPAEGRRLVSRASVEPPLEDAKSDLLSLALFYRQMHQLELAERVLSRFMAGSDVPPEAHLILGSVYRAQGKPRLALAELKKARSMADGAEHAAVSYEMGLCHEMLSQLKKANSFVSAAIALEPDNPHMHLSLGMLYEKQGRPRLARRAYRVASSLNSAFAPALVDISFRLGLAALEEGNLERAISEFGSGVTENPHLFAPHILSEIEHLISHLVEAEQFTNYVEESPPLQQMSDKALAEIEEVFALSTRLSFFVGLSCYWDGYYQEGESSEDVPTEEGPPQLQYEPVEPEATWLEGFGPGGRLLRGATVSAWRGRRNQPTGADDQKGVGFPNRRTENPLGDVADDLARRDEAATARAQMARAETLLGFPPVPFEFIFEEWLNVQGKLASPRIAERPLASPDTYQRLLSVLAAAMQRARTILENEGVFSAEDEPESQENVDLGMALWATIIESYLLRNALEQCRRYPAEFLLHLATAERYRQRRLFTRAARELELAAPLLADNCSVHNFLWNLYIREGRYPEAIEHCHAVLRFTPHYLFQAAAYNDLAYCMVELGQSLNLALLYTEKARELAPQLFDAHIADTVAWLNWKEGRYDEALPLIEEVIEAGYSDDHALLPTSIHFYHYGHILQALGRESEAQEAFATAQEMEVDAESDWGITRRLRKERKKTGS